MLRLISDDDQAGLVVLVEDSLIYINVLYLTLKVFSAKMLASLHH